MDVAMYVLVYGNYISKVKKTAKKPKNKVKYNIHDLMMVNDEGVTHGINGIWLRFWHGITKTEQTVGCTQ